MKAGNVPNFKLLELLFRKQMERHPKPTDLFTRYRDLEPNDPKRRYEHLLKHCNDMFKYQRYDVMRDEAGLGSIGGRTGKAHAATGNDGVCRAWQNTSFCQGFKDGGKCKHSHPENQKGINKSHPSENN